MTYEIKKQSINLTSKSHFIFIFIFLVSLCSYAHHFSAFTDSSDRHYIFLLCNVILVFLFINFDSSPKQNQSVPPHVAALEDEIEEEGNEIIHPHVLVEPVEDEIQEEDDEIKEEDDGMERNENWVYLNEMAEQQVVVVDEEETRELNKRCEEFISKMRERMKLESNKPNNFLLA